jgi:hypothetical protein
LFLGATLAACHNHDSSLSGPDKPLAVGAYHSLVFGDACAAGGGGKGPSFCTTELITQLLESRSEDSSVAEVVPGSQHPKADLAARQFYVVGRAVGETSLVFKGMFDDGSVRESRIAVRVEAPDTFKVADCRQPASTNLLVSVGDAETFELQMFSGSQQLSGWLPGAVTADGLTEEFTDSDTMPYEWQAPATPEIVDLQSSILPDLAVTLTAFGPGQVTEIDLESANAPSPAAFTEPGNFFLTAQVRVQGQAPCRPHAVELHSSTPSICSGPSGESVWQVDDAGSALVAVHAEGSCVLGVGLPGGPVLSTRTFPIFFVQPPPPPTDPNAQGDWCPVEGGTACSASSGAVAVCRGSQWTGTDKSYCAANQVCDFVPDTTPGCVRGTSCARCRGLR